MAQLLAAREARRKARQKRKAATSEMSTQTPGGLNEEDTKIMLD